MPTGILETPTIRPMSVTTTTVKSVWAKTPPITSGPFLPTAWADAATMPIPEGFVMVKNDNKFLYLLFDLTKDTGQSPGVGDYFWLTFDVDGNAAITPNLDVNYGIWPSLPIRIGKQFCLGPGIWTPISLEPTQSLARQEFCATQNSRTTHRIWELCIDLKEVSANLTNVAAPPILHFGLRVSSTTPQFTSDFPPNFYMDFSHLAGILLAANPSLPSIGKPVVAVGIVPVGTGNNDGLDPNTGRATTASGYYLEVKNAAFGGTLNLIGDPTILQSLPITAKYGVTLDGRPLLQSWSNYHYENNQWIYEYVAPDVNGKYNLIPPGEIYSIDHLLFQWNTVGTLLALTT